jgi:hypothetical protein
MSNEGAHHASEFGTFGSGVSDGARGALPPPNGLAPPGPPPNGLATPPGPPPNGLVGCALATNPVANGVDEG